jgi:integrase
MLYGSGLRLSECLDLRVKDVEFEGRRIVVRRGKGQKDRITLLPTSIVETLQQHLGVVRTLHQQDLAKGFGRVVLPDALPRK